jgi:hypothetical protein
MKKFFIIGCVVITTLFALILVSIKINASCGSAITITPASYDMGSVPVSRHSSVYLVNVTNNNCGPLTNLTLTLMGANPDQFVLDPYGCGSTLYTNATCQARVSFAPDAEGSFTANFNADSDQTALTDGTDLSGIGTPAPAISDSAAALLISTLNGGDSDGCNATASTGAAGKTSSGPAALGLIALMGLVLGTVTVRRRMRKRS